MSKIKVLIVEDEIIISMELQMLLDNMGYSTLNPAPNYDAALNCIENNKPDICILDIQLDGEKTGLDVARYLNKSKNIPFIFLTNLSNPEVLDEAKQCKPHAYLVKPYQKENLYSAIELALYNFHNTSIFSDKQEAINTSENFLIKDKGNYIKVPYNEILYAKSDHIYISLFTKKNKTYLIRSTIGDLFKILPKTFIRIHRSYIVNMPHISAYKFPNVIFNETKVPVSRTYKKSFDKALETFYKIKK